MAETKEELVNLVRQWVGLENEMKILNKELKDRRQQKKALTESLVEVMKGHDIDCFDITDGKLMYTKNRVKAPINKKLLFESLAAYLSESGVPAEEVAKMVNHVLDSREVKTKEGVRLKANKS
jgi:hypothetical protein